jgi:pyruvate-ferredoxin/flavodoxin oxidoreductase
VLRLAVEGGTFLLNAPHGPEEIWDRLPRPVQKRIVEPKLRFFVIDATRVASERDSGGGSTPILQTCFFAISGVLPRDEAIARSSRRDREVLWRKGAHVVEKNFEAVDARWRTCTRFACRRRLTSTVEPPPWCRRSRRSSCATGDARMMEGRGDELR